MSGTANPRYVQRTMRERLRKRVRAENQPCHICGREIDYSLPAGHPMSYELDEVVPVSKGGSPYSYENCKASHRICNERKGARLDWRRKVGRPTQPPETSREW